jgi:hypothetical protein
MKGSTQVLPFFMGCSFTISLYAIAILAGSYPAVLTSRRLLLKRLLG